MNKAEHKCRKLKMGGVGFSEATELPKHVIAFWELAIKRRSGIRISPQHWKRKRKKAKVTEDSKDLSLDDMMERLKSAKKEYKTAKSNHKEERVKFLDTMKPKDRDRLTKRPENWVE
jgi:hypothetical protein